MKKYSEEDYTGRFNLLKAEKQLIIRAISVKSTKKDAAAALGISVRNLYHKIHQHSLKT